MANRSENLKEQVVEWAGRVGKPEALKRLVERDVPVHTADKLISGRYPSEPRSLLSAAIEKAMGSASRGGRAS